MAPHMDWTGVSRRLDVLALELDERIEMTDLEHALEDLHKKRDAYYIAKSEYEEAMRAYNEVKDASSSVQVQQ